MASPEDILASMKIEKGSKHTASLPKTVKLSSNTNCNAPDTVDQMNKIFSSCNLPTFRKEDTINERIEKFEILQNEEAFKNIECEGWKDKLCKIEEWKKMEEECDMKEVELANMQVETQHKYNNRSVQELKDILNERRRVLEGQRVLRANKNVLDEIAIKKDGCFASFSFLKDAVLGSYYKEVAKEMLKDKMDDLRRVLYKIVISDVCKVEEMGKELGIERVCLLKIVYNLSSKNIIEYDRLSDTLHMVGRNLSG